MQYLLFHISDNFFVTDCQTLYRYLKERNHFWDKFWRFSRILAQFAKLNPREKSSENQFAKINPREFN